MDPSELDRLRASYLCLGVMVGMLGIDLPTKVADVVSRIRADEDVSQIEVDLAISILEALIRNDKPKLHQWINVRRSILKPTECNSWIN